MYEAYRKNIPVVLAGSIRDDGPLPDVITDVVEAQRAMRRHVPEIGMALFVSTAAALDRRRQPAAGDVQVDLRRHQPRERHQTRRPRLDPNDRPRDGRRIVPARARRSGRGRRGRSGPRAAGGYWVVKEPIGVTAVPPAHGPDVAKTYVPVTE